MAAPFLRLVESFDALAKAGTTAEFFAGPDYKMIPQDYVEAIKDFSLKHLKTAGISKPSSDEVDNLSPFVLRFSEKEAEDLMVGFFDLVEQEIVHSIELATKKIAKSLSSSEHKSSKKSEHSSAAAIELVSKAFSAGAILDRDLDETFDALRNASDLRDYLLHLKAFAKRQVKAGNKSAALIIEA